MPPPSDRLVSLDQFRGYTVLGMFVVNFVGGYAAVPTVLHHKHTYCSYADTIMPQFLFAVGFALRLTFLRRREREGTAVAYRKVINRCLGLFLLAVVVHGLTGSYRTWADLQKTSWAALAELTFKRGPFETLGHIAVTLLFVLPVIAAPGWQRVLYAAAAGGFHAWLSHVWYYEWNWPHARPGVPTLPNGIDGGPLGFLTWCIPTVAGTLAHDWVAADRPGDPSGSVRKMVVWGVVLMALGYGLSCLHRVTPPNSVPEDAGLTAYLAQPPFVPPADDKAAEQGRNYWAMSQRAGSVTYPLFGAGFALAVMALFRVLSDGWGLRLGYLDLLGQNALAGYILHGMVMGVVKPFVPKDAPDWYVWTGFAVFLGITTLFLRYLDRNRLYLRL